MVPLGARYLYTLPNPCETGKAGGITTIFKMEISILLHDLSRAKPKSQGRLSQ